MVTKTKRVRQSKVRDFVDKMYPVEPAVEPEPKPGLAPKPEPKVEPKGDAKSEPEPKLVDKDEMKRLHQAGVSVKDLAKQFGLTLKEAHHIVD